MAISRIAMGLFSSWIVALAGIFPQSYPPDSCASVRGWLDEKERNLQNRYKPVMTPANRTEEDLLRALHRFHETNARLYLPKELRQRSNERTSGGYIKVENCDGV